MSETSSKVVNLLLATLPSAEYQRLVPHLDHVSLPFKQVLHKRGESIKYVYFPDQAIISLISTLQDGSIVEVGIVGNEGIVGIPTALGDNIATTTAMVQLAGFGTRMEASLLRTEFGQGGYLQSLLLRYTQALYAQLSQGVACNRRHQLEERFARWLLLVCDRRASNELPLTQQFISKMLGVRRAGVTEVTNSFQLRGMIRYTRGKITILNRQKLEATSCECYEILKGEYARLLGTETVTETVEHKVI